jgi:hypothetical protein
MFLGNARGNFKKLHLTALLICAMMEVSQKEGGLLQAIYGVTELSYLDQLVHDVRAGWVLISQI